MSENNGNGKPRTRREEYEQATAGLKFTKDFMTAIEAVMRDEMAPIGQRIMAWIKYTSWGRYSLFCINEDGTEAFQSDCARNLKIDRRRVSDTFRYFEIRGYLERRGIAKVVYPSISPVLTGPDQSIVNMSAAHRTFLELWRVQCAPDNAELQVHLAAVKRIIKVRDAKESAWRADGTNPRASLIDSEITEDVEVEEEIAAAGGPVREYTDTEQPSLPASPPPDPLASGLTARKISYEAKDLENIREVLRDTPLQTFWAILDDRLTRGRIGIPILLDKALQARQTHERSAATNSAPERTDRNAYWIAECHRVLGDPDASEDEKIAARQTLDLTNGRAHGAAI